MSRRAYGPGDSGRSPAHKQLAERGIHVKRSFVNEYCTSLDMAGASITLVKLDDEIEALLDAPAEVAVRVF